METYQTIKNFLADGGKCLLIENGKPIGVVLTMEEYEKLKENKKSELLMSDINMPATAIDDFGIGEAIAKEIDPSSAKIEDLDFNSSSDDIALEDLGLDELPY